MKILGILILLVVLGIFTWGLSLVPTTFWLVWAIYEVTTENRGANV